MYLKKRATGTSRVGDAGILRIARGPDRGQAAADATRSGATAGCTGAGAASSRKNVTKARKTTAAAAAGTSQNHVQATLRKLQLANRVELTRYAIEQGLE